MTRVEILPEPDSAGAVTYTAVAGDKQSRGRTPGEALDGIIGQLSDESSAVLIIMQGMQPDRFFTANQRQRLQELMAQWREARNASRDLPEPERSELDALVEAETRASGLRAAALLDDRS